MAYMSYCRHEGTHYELRCCLGDVQEHIDGEAEYRVSENEIGHFEEMVRDFYEFLCENDILDNFGELDEDNLNRVLDSMTKGCNDD